MDLPAFEAAFLFSLHINRRDLHRSVRPELFASQEQPATPLIISAILFFPQIDLNWRGFLVG
jgi:hypothetical protein